MSILMVMVASALLLSALRDFYTFTFIWNLNTKAFMSMIQKLVMANNIDRAIKLCNAEPNATASTAIKPLLCHANRPYALFLTYMESRALVRVRAAPSLRGKWLPLILGLTLLALGAGVATSGHPGRVAGPDPLFLLALAEGALALFLGRIYQKRVETHVVRVDWALLKTLNLLLARSKYKPIQWSPEEMSPEELEAWRVSMGAVEAKAVETGPGTAQGIHDSLASPTTGVLPPL